MPILRNLTTAQRIGLAIVFGVFVLMLAQVATAETLQCYPAHTPYRADPLIARIDPELLGLILCVGAILFMW